MLRPFASEADWTLYHGHVLDVLRQLPDESVHAVVTSPPYWGLRDYQLPPTVWGGRDDCPHQWDVEVRPGQSGGSSSPKRQTKGTQKFQRFGATQYATCRLCGAWQGQLGLEPTPELYVEHLVQVFREIRRVLRCDGTVWLNLGDSYNGSGGAGGDYGPGGLREGQPRYPGRHVGHLKPKDLVGIPWMVAFALRDDGWWLRSDIIWAKVNPMPESVTDRPTKAHEYVFLLARAERYYYDADAIREPYAQASIERARLPYRSGVPSAQATANPAIRGRDGVVPPNPLGRNRRTVWFIPTEPYPGAHFATFPRALIEPMILAATSPKACPQCGAPWRRVTEESPEVLNAWSDKGARRFDAGQNRYVPASPASTLKWVLRVETVGWEPTCDCPGNDGSGRCVVLDPFAGSGTTIQVAVELGRAAIGIELSQAYCQLVVERMETVQRPLFALADL